ncbi:hypothetical protein H0H93_007327 [Arthromyces matolae]|nr:hypothetical protein H0H93_007327 [Arthromyces matolae]
MFDPFNVYHPSIDASTEDPPNSDAPRLFSTLDYFVQYSKNLFESKVLEKWSELGTTAPDSSDEEFYHIPDRFYRETAFQILCSLPEAHQHQVEQDAMSANHAMLLPYYESQLRELFKDKMMSLHGDNGTLRTVDNILRPIITALEAVTNLKILCVAGGCNDNEIGAVM